MRRRMAVYIEYKNTLSARGKQAQKKNARARSFLYVYSTLTRSIVCSRSGPTEMMPSFTPVS
ncbi:hypothetical protein, partial [Negativicoccus succinicivorans]|uniref:hypothetical protein n=1 Tax=Negativicoccus succinicivorans TaxID=620903 RepID=UPI0026F28130